MKIPAHVKDILQRFAAKYPIPQIDPGEEAPVFEDRVRQWNIKRIEHVVFETNNNEGWGAKRADSGRPIGKDSIAQRSLTSSALICWDTLLGTGTGHPTAILDPDSIDIADQVFVEVPGVDWIGETPEDPPDDDDPPVSDDLVLAALETISAKIQPCRFEPPPPLDLTAVVALLHDVNTKLDRVLQQQDAAYVGAVGFRLRLTPERP